MWPRLIAQLVELLPHAARLLPMADNYLASRREGDRAQAAALAEFADGMRGDIGRVTDTYDALSRQLADQKQQILAIRESLDLAQTNSTLQTKQLEWITSDVNSLRVWVKFGMVIIVLLLSALIVLAVQILHSR
jgi:hypothetical protein